MSRYTSLDLDALKQRQFRVVRIIARLNVGGPAQHVLHLTRGLAHDYPTLLVTGDVDAGEAEVAMGADVAICRIPELGRRVHPAQDITAFLKILRILRAVRPQIVHTHTAKAGTLGRLAAVCARVPVRVHTFHGHVFDGYFGPLLSWLVVAVERVLALLTSRIIAISEQQAHDLTQRYRVCGKARIAIVPLGLELGRFRSTERIRLRDEFRRELGIDTRFVVTSVGRLVPIKHHELLLRAAALLERERGDVTLLIVGDGAERERLERLAHTLQLPNVRFLGWRADLHRIYAASDLVALTSRNEGTPVCLIEAMSAGVAVVATDVGGVRDVIRHGHSGLLVAPEDRRGLAHAINRLLDDEHTRQRFARAGARWVPERFSVQRLLTDMRALYERELERRGARRPVPQPAAAPATATSPAHAPVAAE